MPLYLENHKLENYKYKTNSYTHNIFPTIYTV
jgi:hypothetical protein